MSDYYKKLVCALVVGVLVLSTYLIVVPRPAYASESPGAQHEATESVVMNEGAFEAAKETGTIQAQQNPLNKIAPSLRDLALSSSKDMTEVVITTTNMAELAPLLNKLGAYRASSVEDIKERHEPLFGQDISSGKLVSPRVYVPSYALPAIASLRGVVSIDRPNNPRPLMMENVATKEEQDFLRQWKEKATGNPSIPKPTEWGTVKAHKAVDVWTDYGINGSGVYAAVIDTGVDFAHPNLVGQWATVRNASSPYYGWPIMLHSGSMDLLEGYFTAGSDFDRYPYPVFASFGESSWYSDTSYTAQVNATGYLNYSHRYAGQYTKRYNPNGYGGSPNMNRISRQYFVGIPGTPGAIESRSNLFHLGIAKDDWLTALYGERVGMLVVDSKIPKVYDTVYIDLDNDHDFTDEKPCTRDSPLSWTEKDEYIGGYPGSYGGVWQIIENDTNPHNWTYTWTGGNWSDGIPDISGGLLYFIGNTTASISGEVVIASATGAETTANLANGDIATDIVGYDTIVTLKLYQDGNYWPSSYEDIYEDIITNAAGNEKGTKTALTAGVNINTGEAVNSSWVLQNYPLEMIYDIGNDTASFVEGVDFSINMTTGEITWLRNLTVGDNVYIIYEFDTWSFNFNTGEITFHNPPLAGAQLTADYETGLPVPYSTTYTEMYGYDNFIPASGDLVAMFGSFNYDVPTNYHGTLVATSLAGNPVGNLYGILDVYGPAPGAKIVGIELFEAPSVFDAIRFAAEGYDGIPGTGDEAQIASNSWGFGGQLETGWTSLERSLWNLTTNYAPDFTILFGAANNGPGYGTTAPPGSGPGVITVGAGTNMNYRHLFGYDGGEAYYCWPLIGQGDFGCGSFGDMADFSSKGPTLLGTAEPDITSVGMFAIGGCPLNYAIGQGWGPDGLNAWDLWSGTSLSTPVTAGIVALMYSAYYAKHGTWPTSELIRDALMSSADDHQMDVLSQGSGWANALRAVSTMNETGGIVSDVTKWSPGGYNGKHREGFINFMEPGGPSDSTDITLTNYGPTPETVDVSGDWFEKVGEFTFDWNFSSPWPISERVILNATGVWALDGTPIKTQDLSTLWNSDFLKFNIERNPAVLSTIPYTYVELFDWYDSPHSVTSELVGKAYVHTEDNETLLVGTYGETKARTSYPSFGPYWFYLNGTLLTDGVDYTYDQTTGWVALTNPLGDGEILNATYKWYEAIGSGDTFGLAHDSIVPGSVTAYLNGSVWDWNFGANWTVDYANGDFTVWINLQPGDVVEIDYTWEHKDVYDGWYEVNRMAIGLPGPGADVVSVMLYSPSTRVHNGLVLSVRDVNGAAGISPVTIEFYSKQTWNWLSFDSTTLAIPALGTNAFKATMQVPGGVDAGSYEGAVYVTDSKGNVTTIPIVVNIAVTDFPAFLGGGTPQTSLYDNNGVIQGQKPGQWRQVGDSRFFWVDLPELATADNKKMLFDLFWTHETSDIDMYLFTQTPDSVWTNDDMWGPSTVTLTAFTKELDGVTDTLRSDAEYMGSGIYNGLIALQYRAYTASEVAEPFHGDVGYMTVDPIDFRASSNKLAGSKEVVVTANVPLVDGVGAAVTEEKQTVWSAQPVDPYSYPGGSFSEYLYNAPNKLMTYVPDQTIAAKWSLYFYNGASDVDMGNFYDANCDGSYTVDDEFDTGHVAATSANPEVFSASFPPEGCYWVHAAGYDVAPGSLFDLTFSLSLIGAGAFQPVNAANTTVPPNTPSTFGIAWDLPGSTSEGHISSVLLVSPGYAPFALTQPINIDFRYDITPPTILGYLPSMGSVVTTQYPAISASMQSIPNNEGDIDPTSLRMWLDGTEITDVMDVSVPFDSNNGYWLGTASYIPEAPLSEGYHSLRIEAMDISGNTGYYTWSFMVDTTGPPLSVDYPTDNMVTSEKNITVRGTTSPDAIVEISGEAVTVLPDGSFAHEISLKENISNEIVVTATDQWGNSASVERTAWLDTTIPSVENLVAIPIGVTNAPFTKITGVFSEAVTLTIAGIDVPVNPDGTFEAFIPLAEGDNVIDIEAVDQAGNLFEDTSLVITKDTRAPVIVLDAYPTQASQPTVNISGTVDADTRGVTVNGLPAVLTGNRFEKKNVALSFGPNTFTVMAVDEAGNVAQAAISIDYSPQAIHKVQSYMTIYLIVAAIVLLIVGLVIGFLVGKKPAAPEVAEEEVPPEEEAAPVEEEIPEVPEEEAEEELFAGLEEEPITEEEAPKEGEL